MASKDYGSRQVFMDEVLTPFGARFADGEPFRPVTIHGVYADGAMVIVHWDGHGVANDGEPYDNAYVWLMRLRDDLVIGDHAHALTTVSVQWSGAKRFSAGFRLA